MATVYPVEAAPVNLTSNILEALTLRDIKKGPEVSIQPIDDDGSSTTSGEVVVTIPEIGLVREHRPVRSSYHSISVSLRQDLQVHLRSVMKTGDDMLFKIRAIVEELDTAEHERRLYKEQYDDICIKRDQIRLQLETVSTECVKLRTHLIEMSKQRDRAEVDLEGVRGLLLERESECKELKQESIRLHLQITEINERFEKYRLRLQVSEDKVRSYFEEVTQLRLEIEVHKKENISLTETSIKLGKELAQLRFESKELKIILKKAETDLQSAQTRLTVVLVELETVKKELKEAIIVRDRAIVDLDLSLKDREKLRKHAEDCKLERDDAIRSRDRAIFELGTNKENYLRESLLLQDSQRQLTTLRKTVEVISVENGNLKRDTETYEHMRDEAIEMFEKADRARHRLTQELALAAKTERDIRLEVDKANRRTITVEEERTVVVKEKELVEVRLNEVEREKFQAIAKYNQALENYKTVDDARDIADRALNDMKAGWNDLTKENHLLVERYNTATAKELAATHKAEILDGSLTKTQANLDIAIKEKNDVAAELQKKKADADQAEKLLNEKNTTLTNQNTSLTTRLAAAEQTAAEQTKKVEQLEARYTGPGKEANGVLINSIFWGSTRLSDPVIYQRVLDSSIHEDVSFKVLEKYMGATNNGQKSLGQPRWLGVFYSVRRNGQLVDQLPLWYKESDSKQEFKPNRK